jgi:hypothetical protein
VYLLSSSWNELRYSTIYGQPAIFAKDGSAGNYVHHNDVHGALHLRAAGPNNYWHANDYFDGFCRSEGGTQWPNFLGPSANCTVNNQDGGFYEY